FREPSHPHHIVVASSDVQWQAAPPLRRSSRWSGTSSKTRAGGRELTLPHLRLAQIGGAARACCPPPMRSDKLAPTTNSRTASALAPKRRERLHGNGARHGREAAAARCAACATHHPQGSYARRRSGPRVQPHCAGADQRGGTCAAERRADLERGI